MFFPKIRQFLLEVKIKVIFRGKNQLSKPFTKIHSFKKMCLSSSFTYACQISNPKLINLESYSLWYIVLMLNSIESTFFTNDFRTIENWKKYKEQNNFVQTFCIYMPNASSKKMWQVCFNQGSMLNLTTNKTFTALRHQKPSIDT